MRDAITVAIASCLAACIGGGDRSGGEHVADSSVPHDVIDAPTPCSLDGSTEDAEELYACPAQQPSGSCPGCPTSCNYGCTFCSCVPGSSWLCTGPSCPATCIDGPTPSEGDPCGGGTGGCCPVVRVGDTCPFSCEDGGGPGEVTCELAQDAAAATWHLSMCPGTFDGGVDAAVEE